MLNLDLTSDFGQRVARRLREERLIWLVTIDSNGLPQPSPVWFWWDGESFLIYSQRGRATKVRNIHRHPQVALHFDGDGRGGDIIIFTGMARLDPEAPLADQQVEYAQKYPWGFERIHQTAEQFAADYSIALRVTPEKVRGH